MLRHSENAQKIAEFLQGHPKVSWVRYPGLADDPAHALAQAYLPAGCGGMVVFGIKGGSREAMKLVDSIRLFSLLANVGDAKSLIIHPALQPIPSRRGSSAKSRLAAELIRLSIGLEHIEDIQAALADALALI